MSLLAARDRVQEFVQSPGSSDFVLAGASDVSYITFAEAVPSVDGDFVPYCARHRTSGQWEVGRGIFDEATNTLSRFQVFRNSSGGTSVVAFSSGIVDVWIDYPAEKSVLRDADSDDVGFDGDIRVAGDTEFGGIAYTWPVTQAPGYVLTTDGAGGLSWDSPLENIALTDLSDVTITGQAQGDLLYASSANQWVNLSKGANPNTVLGQSGGIPAWLSTVALSVLILGTDPGGSDILRVGGSGTFSGTVTAARLVAGVDPDPTDTGSLINAATNGNAALSLMAAGAGTPVFQFYRTLGTVTAPTQITGSSTIGTWNGWGASGSGISTLKKVGEIALVSDGAITSSSSPGYWSFRTVGTGSTSATERWRLTSDGHFITGATNSYDLGSAAAMVRVGYFGTQLIVGANNFSSIAGYVAEGGSALAAADQFRYSNLVGTGASYNLYRLRGTSFADKAAVLSGDVLGRITMGGYDGTNVLSQTGAAFVASAAENWTTIAHGTQAEVHTTAIGSTALTQRWLWSATGHYRAASDNAYDIGAAGAGRPNTVYIGSGLIVGADPGTANAVRFGGSLTVGGNIMPEASNTRDLGIATLGWRAVWMIHSQSLPAGVNLVQTGAGAGSPRVMMENTTSWPASGVALYNDAANTMSFTTGATVNTSTGTSRWHYNTTAIYPETNNAIDLGLSGTKFRTGYFATSVISGTDPGGSGFLRVGGTSYLNGDVTLGGNVLPAANDTYNLGSSSAGFKAVQIRHTSNQATGLLLVSTAVGGQTPRIMWENTVDWPGAGAAIRLINSSSLGFSTGATAGSGSGTGRWHYDVNGISPDTDNTYALGAASNRWSSLLVGTSIVVGTDPGGSEALRVGGALRVQVTSSGASILSNPGAGIDNAWTLSRQAGQNGELRFATNTSSRWIFRIDNVAESGSDAGSNFQILARTDAGAAIDTPFEIQRVSTGTIIMRRTVAVGTSNTYDLASSSTRFRSGYFATSVVAPLFGSVTAADVAFQRNSVTILTLGAALVTLGVDTITNGNADFVFQRNSVTQLTLASLAATFAGTIATAAPTGGAGAWKLGIANVVSPTAPNRTVTIDVGGTVYYLAAKTTND